VIAWPTVTIEIGFATANPLTAHATTTWSDVTGDVTAFTIKRGRQDALGRIEAGTATVTLDNTDRKYDNQYIGSPYYPNVKPMRKIRIRASYSAVTYYLFTGYIEAWPMDYGGGLDAESTIRCVDAFKFFAQKKLNGAYTNEFTGDSINTWLTSISWPAADRQIFSGQSQIQSGTFVNVPALTHFQNVADVESGLFFMDGQGRATFHNRHYRLTAGSTVVASFSDKDSGSPSGSDLFYLSVVLAYDDSLLYNEARITRTGGTEQVSTDTSSGDEYFLRTYTKTLPLLTDVEALSLAQWITSRYGQPSFRFTSVTLDGLMQDDLWPHILGRAISDRVNVYQLPPIGSGLGTAIAKDCYIEGVAHNVNVAGGALVWQTTFQLSPADALQYWVLEDATLGVLDSTTRLAY
jgi:hypothetical protein